MVKDEFESCQHCLAHVNMVQRQESTTLLEKYTLVSVTEQKQIQFTGERHTQYFNVVIPGSRNHLKLLQLKES